MQFVSTFPLLKKEKNLNSVFLVIFWGRETQEFHGGHKTWKEDTPVPEGPGISYASARVLRML